MKFYWRPETHVPFIGICWGFGQVSLALWPVVVQFGRSAYGKRLADIHDELQRHRRRA